VEERSPKIMLLLIWSKTDHLPTLFFMETQILKKYAAQMRVRCMCMHMYKHMYAEEENIFERLVLKKQTYQRCVSVTTKTWVIQTHDKCTYLPT
jgi:hypothetical protein